MFKMIYTLYQTSDTVISEVWDLSTGRKEINSWPVKLLSVI